jgi:large subunit ribosomal protein L3
MTQIFTDDGLCVPVTVIAVKDGNYVSAVKTADADGYNAVQVAYDAVAEHKITKPEVGHLAKAGVKPMRHVEEFRLAAPADGITVGQKLSAPEMFKEGDYVDIRGTSIGKGFQGSVKRHGFARGLMTHGSKSHRQHGSVGAGTYPGRIFPGKKMHGHMGNETTTIKQLKIMRVEDDCIIIRGNVPGKKGNLIRVAPAKIVGKNC